MVPALIESRLHIPHFAAAAVVLGLLAAPCVSGEAQGETGQNLRGIILSTHTDGSDWSSPTVASTMKDIRQVGADWVSIHPYAWIRGNGSVRFHRFDPADPPDYIADPIRDAHAAGLKILIKPHLGYWGSPFAWRGDIAFDTETEWNRFFREYKEWITLLAEACREADGFVVGTELDSTLVYEEEWRDIVRAVRARTDVPLTYAANWTHYRQVGFWDLLDVVGIQAYFPLTELRDPDIGALNRGWSRIMTELRQYSQEHNRAIVFTELGYNRSHAAAVEPWSSRLDGKEAEATQALCLDAALKAIEEEPAVLGAFLWKWFPNPHPVGRNFQLATPALKQVIQGVWLQTPSRTVD